MKLRSLSTGAGGLVLALSTLSGAVQADPIALAPTLAGQYQAGHGVDARFLKIDDAWRQSSVLWDEANGVFGSGVPISTYAWGTGLWGIADWQTANLSPTPDMIQGSWSGRVAQIAWSDDLYNDLYGANWGTVDLAPLFSGPSSQDNWTSSFGGYIRITEAGLYNFSVLHDDGFFFKLHGASGSTLEISNDFLNPRDRLGFASELLLSAGLYSFELGAYDRLEAGVVELTWSRNGEAWTRVPTEHLVAYDAVMAVPEPGSWGLMVIGLLAMGAQAARRRRRG
jgi:hypothetical protein